MGTRVRRRTTSGAISLMTRAGLPGVADRAVLAAEPQDDVAIEFQPSLARQSPGRHLFPAVAAFLDSGQDVVVTAFQTQMNPFEAGGRQNPKIYPDPYGECTGPSRKP